MVKGSFKKGKLADLTVILQDIMKLPQLENSAHHQAKSFVGGRLVHGSKGTTQQGMPTLLARLRISFVES